MSLVHNSNFLSLRFAPMKIRPLESVIGFSDLEHLANQAQSVMKQVRSAMLAPELIKTPPSMNTVELAELCGVDRAQIQYRLGRNQGLPEGQMNGSRREWPLHEVRQWAQILRASKMRNPEKAAGVVITVANFKGGVTKTTTAVTIAQGLSMRGHKVLMVDTDPQGSATMLYGILPDTEVSEEMTILPLCAGDTDSIDSAIRPTYWDGIDIVCAAPTLFNAEFLLPSRQLKDPSFEFWRVLDRGLDSARDKYDVIIIDTPPSLSYITINALIAATGVIMPLPPNALDFASSGQFWKLFTEVCSGLFEHRGDEKKFAFVDVVLARVDRADVISTSIREWIGTAYGGRVLPVEIPKTATAATASAEFGTVFDLDGKSGQARTLKRAKDAYNQLIDYIEEQVQGVWAADVIAFDAQQRSQA